MSFLIQSPGILPDSSTIVLNSGGALKIQNENYRTNTTSTNTVSHTSLNSKKFYRGAFSGVTSAALGTVAPTMNGNNATTYQRISAFGTTVSASQANPFIQASSDFAIEWTMQQSTNHTIVQYKISYLYSGGLYLWHAAAYWNTAPAITSIGFNLSGATWSIVRTEISESD